MKELWKEDAYGHIAELVPVSLLDTFKEHDRLKKTWKPDGYMEELASDILHNGIKDPLIASYNPETQQILLIEGNHRLAVAKKHGIEYLPLRIVRSRFVKGTFIPNGLSYKNHQGHINADLRPSEVFRWKLKNAS